MSRRLPRLSVLIAVLAVLAGCAVQQPQPSTSPTQPSASASSVRPTLMIGNDGSAVGQLLAEIYAQALTAKGVPASTTLVSPDAQQTVPLLTSGKVAAWPVFIRQVARSLSLDEVAPEVDDAASDLAAALDGEAAVLQPTALRNEPVYLTRWSSGEQAQPTSLADLKALRQPLTLALPTDLLTAPEGPEGLQVLYGLKVKTMAVDDPGARLTSLGKTAQLAIFRPTDPQVNDPSVVRLADPELISVPDPEAVLLSPGLAEDPDVVLVLKAVGDALSNQAISQLRLQAQTQGTGPAVTAWLPTVGLAG